MIRSDIKLGSPVVEDFLVERIEHGCSQNVDDEQSHPRRHVVRRYRERYSQDHGRELPPAMVESERSAIDIEAHCIYTVVSELLIGYLRISMVTFEADVTLG